MRIAICCALLIAGCGSAGEPSSSGTPSKPAVPAGPTSAKELAEKALAAVGKSDVAALKQLYLTHDELTSTVECKFDVVGDLDKEVAELEKGLTAAKNHMPVTLTEWTEKHSVFKAGDLANHCTAKRVFELAQGTASFKVGHVEGDSFDFDMVKLERGWRIWRMVRMN